MSLESRARTLAADHGAPDAITVSELYDRVERAVRGAFPEEVWVTGEVRSMKVLTKGHCFLDLVDPAQADDPGRPNPQRQVLGRYLALDPGRPGAAGHHPRGRDGRAGPW